jgi:hypothetical protein
VEINTTGAAMIRKPVSLVSTGVASEETLWINWLRLERKGMVLVEKVFDLLGQLVAFGVEDKVARCARVDGAGGVELAGRATGNLA